VSAPCLWNFARGKESLMYVFAWSANCFYSPFAFLFLLVYTLH
jgi:hypothetical protein